MTNNRFNWKSLTRFIVFAGMAVFALLLQIACIPIPEPRQEPILIHLYIDVSVVWPDEKTKKRWIEEIVTGLKENAMIYEVVVVEFGKTRKVAETFGENLNFGKPADCPPPRIRAEEVGNRVAEQRAKAEAENKCKIAKEERLARMAPALEKLTVFLRRSAKGLTPCTSFADLIKRLRQDQPEYGLIVTDGRANCREEIGEFKPQDEFKTRIVVIQCPVADGKADENTAALKKMMPTSVLLALPQTGEAMKKLIGG